MRVGLTIFMIVLLVGIILYLTVFRILKQWFEYYNLGVKSVNPKEKGLPPVGSALAESGIPNRYWDAFLRGRSAANRKAESAQVRVREWKGME